MSKDRPRHHITWQLSNDGLRPTEAEHGFVLRNPVSKAVPPGTKVTIDLCVAANVPMLAFPARSHSDDLTVNGGMVVPSGADITVTIENKSQYSTLIVEDKEVLVNLFPLLHEGSTSEVG